LKVTLITLELMKEEAHSSNRRSPMAYRL
jgi:hypothetical protein